MTTDTATVPQRPRDLDFNTGRNIAYFMSLYGAGGEPFEGTDEEKSAAQDAYEYHSSLERFLETLQPPCLKNRNTRICFSETGNSNSNLVLIRGKKVWGTDERTPISSGEISSITSDVPSAFVLSKFPNKPATKDMRLIILVNADTSSVDEPPSYTMTGESLVEDKGFPSISFCCLGRFYLKNGTLGGAINTALKKLEEGNLRLVDYVPDDSVQVPSDQAKKYRTWAAKSPKKRGKSPIAPPGKGYTLIGGGPNLQWHRPATVLLEDLETEQFMLFGQDGDQYFGVELAAPAKNIAAAFNGLIPDAVKSHPDAKRQGEWFIVNVEESVIPAKADCVLLGDSSGYSSSASVFMPIQTDEDNLHRLESSDVRVSKDGKLYADSPTLEHDQHESVSKQGWCTFHRNTAVRSVSQQGVD